MDDEHLHIMHDAIKEARRMSKGGTVRVESAALMDAIGHDQTTFYKALAKAKVKWPDLYTDYYTASGRKMRGAGVEAEPESKRKGAVARTYEPPAEEAEAENASEGLTVADSLSTIASILEQWDEEVQCRILSAVEVLLDIKRDKPVKGKK